MDYAFQLILQSRKNLVEILDTMTISQINTIPIGFNNNIVWNIAHLVATFDILSYKLNEMSGQCDSKFIDLYKKGSFPVSQVDENFIKNLKTMLISQVDQIQSDYQAKKFPISLPQPYKTSFRNELKNIEDIILFNLVHEGIHFGVILGLKKFV